MFCRLQPLSLLSLAGEGVWPGPETNVPDAALPPLPEDKDGQESRWAPGRGTEATVLLLWGGRPSLAPHGPAAPPLGLMPER